MIKVYFYFVVLCYQLSRLIRITKHNRGFFYLKINLDMIMCNFNKANITCTYIQLKLSNKIILEVQFEIFTNTLIFKRFNLKSKYITCRINTYNTVQLLQNKFIN